MVQALKDFFANQFNFKGRATRSDYWWVVLWSVIFAFSYMFLMFLIVFLTSLFAENSNTIDAVMTFLMIPYWIVCLGIYIPSLSLMSRRFHDAGISSLWYFIPYGVIMLAVFTVVIWAISITSDTYISDASGVAFLIYIIIFYLISFAFGIFEFVVTLLPSKPDNKWGANPHGAKQIENKVVNYTCQECGCFVGGDDTFCPHCGKQLK